MKIVSVCLLALCLCTPAFADEWRVNATRDEADNDPGDGVCSTGLMLPRTGEWECTLRAAIQESNARFHAGVHRIYLPAGVYDLRGPFISPESEEAAQMHGTWTVNQAAGNGDLDVDADIVIVGDGPERTIISGSGHRVFDVWGQAAREVSLHQLTVRDGVVAGPGGCIYHRGGDTILSLNRVVVEECSARGSAGGGMLNNGVALLERATFRHNRALRGGGLENGYIARVNESTFERNETGPTTRTLDSGGAIANVTAHGTVPYLTVTNTTISNNRSNEGGGLLNLGSAVLMNSTVSGNGAAAGAGIYFGPALAAAGRGHEELFLIYSTIASNRGVGVQRTSTRPLVLSHALLADNRVSGTPGFNCAGGVTRSDHTMEDADTCGLAGEGDRVSVDPSIGPLLDNGGPTMTHALQAGSPAIDAGRPGTAVQVGGRDQRGTLRPLGAATDIGAYEYGVDPRWLTLRVPIRWFHVLPLETGGMTISYSIRLSLRSGGSSGDGGERASIIEVHGGDAAGQLQYELDKGGKVVTISGIALPPSKPGDNTRDAEKDGPVLFYVDVRRDLYGASQLRFDSVVCSDCPGTMPKASPVVIAPYTPRK